MRFLGCISPFFMRHTVARAGEESKLGGRQTTGLIMVALLLIVQPLLSFAGEITAIRAGKQTQNEIEIFIEGEYQSYRAVGLRSPARFVIDLEGSLLANGLPKTFELNGPIVSAIETGQRDNHLSIVLYSANATELFHSTIQDKKGILVVKCWKPQETTAPPVMDNALSPGPMTPAVLPKKELSDLFGWQEEDEAVSEKQETEKVARFTGNKITVTFFKEDLHNVFRIFATPGLIDREINLMVDDQVQGEVTLALNEVPWDLVLNIVLEENSLIMEEKAEGIYIIKNRPEKAEKETGELIVRQFSEEILQPAQQVKLKKENRQKAQEMILEAHNLEIQGKPEEGLVLYEQAYDIWQDNLALIKKMAYLHYTLGNYARSYYFAGEALKINKKDAEGALYAALSAARMKKFEEARVLFEIAIEGSPKIQEVFYNYGLFLERQKEYGYARSVYERYERTFGPMPEVRLAVARTYEEQEKITDACRIYNDIIISGLLKDTKTQQAVQNKIKNLCSRGDNSNGNQK